MSEPTQVRAGDTWTWDIEGGDYPAPDWVQSYSLKSPLNGYTIAADADDTDHVVNVSSDDTADFLPGVYKWVRYAVSGGARYSLATGSIEILPNFSVDDGAYDSRSDNRIIYEGLLEAWKDFSTGKPFRQSYTIGDRAMQFQSPNDLRDAVIFWKEQVDTEEAAEATSTTSGSGILRVRL